MPVFLRGRRAFCIIPAPPTSPRPTLIQSTVSPIRAVPTRTAPIRAAPATLRLPVTPTLTSPPPLLLPPATPFLTLPTSLPPPLGYRSAARTATPPAWSEMPPRTASLLQFCPEHRHGPRPFSCSTRRRTADPRPCSARGTKKADGTAQRSVRRQKATNLSRQHHRGSSSTRQVSARA